MTVFTPTRPTVLHLYRYKGPERLDWLEPIILHHEIYIPSVAQLNDPFDCRPRIAPMSEEELVTFLKNDYIRRSPIIALDLLAQHEQRIRDNIKTHGLDWHIQELTDSLYKQIEEFRVYSLTKRFDNFSLWSKYASEHTGYCLEFANEGDLFQHAFEVQYGEYAPFDLNDQENRNAIFLAYKRRDWSNEEEVRLILPRKKGTSVRLNDPRWLTKVILGMNMSAENEDKIREWARQRQPELKVVRAYLDKVRQELRLK
ncbi:MAG: DUF2971 domain-containing protein [Candidatus Acidiferrum sp.]